jgi:transcriptional regulator with XRE-family HTH domain
LEEFLMKATPKYVRLGALILKTRRGLPMTMEALGKKAKGLSKGYLSGVEQGKVPPPAFEMAQRLATALQLLQPKLFAILCQLLKLPEAALQQPRIAEEIESLYIACGEKKVL